MVVVVVMGREWDTGSFVNISRSVPGGRKKTTTQIM